MLPSGAQDAARHGGQAALGAALPCPAGMHLCQRLAVGEQMVVHSLLSTLCIARLEPGHDQPVLGQRLLQAPSPTASAGGVQLQYLAQIPNHLLQPAVVRQFLHGTVGIPDWPRKGFPVAGGGTNLKQAVNGFRRRCRRPAFCEASKAVLASASPSLERSRRDRARKFR